jgi:chaperonin GroES
MRFKPLQDRVVVKPALQEEKTKGGIIIPGTAQEKPAQGKVVAAGPGRRSDDGRLYAMSVKVGDTVIYGKYSGTEVKLDGEDLVILNETDILGISG